VHGKSKLTETEKVARQVESKVKSMLNKESILEGQKVNSEDNGDVLGRLRENMRRFRPELCREKNWLLHHNTSSHSSFFTREFFLPKLYDCLPSSSLFS
jgi:hypothetical protein